MRKKSHARQHITAAQASKAGRATPRSRPQKPRVPPNRDPEHMAEIGRRGGKKTARRKGKAYFSKIAKLSHPKHNPGAQRGEYKGGRRPNARPVKSPPVPQGTCSRCGKLPCVCNLLPAA